MLARSILLAVLLVSVSLSPLPALEQTPLEQNWGKSFETQKDLQIQNPEAAQEAVTPTGLDGVAAGIVMDAYRASFQAKGQGAESGGAQPMAIGGAGGYSGCQP
ncbi:MAG: hypothetical protein AB1640_05560 [bacterium]